MFVQKNSEVRAPLIRFVAPEVVPSRPPRVQERTTPVGRG